MSEDTRDTSVLVSQLFYPQSGVNAIAGKPNPPCRETVGMAPTESEDVVPLCAGPESSYLIY